MAPQTRYHHMEGLGHRRDEIKIDIIRYAQIYKSNNDLIEYDKVPVPKPAPDKVLINIKYTRVCHTDLHVRPPASLRQWEVINNE
ncbi:hypothetical protein B9Z19DRAFT_1081123 [Tuber borchii]|uniref:Uncharacterized protein n=1 Tax=Tuber borchii TaxID=42251 RepID=A0A2T6ZW62_TUBBO|nr:hypothetical protein B9Z19DRAFT_1081123 [Tuber borchii]